MQQDTRIKLLRRQLATGNSQSSLETLPDRREIEENLNRFINNANDPDQIPSRLRRDISDVLDIVYSSKRWSELPSDWNTPPSMQFATEAVVIADGSRPVFFFEKDEMVEPLAVGTGPFVDAARNNKTPIELAALSVGRIENDIKSPPRGVGKWYEGTAFLIGENLAATNRHVVERMVTDPSSPFGPFMLKSEYWLNFDAQSSSANSRRFSIDNVLYAGPDVIGTGRNIAKLDFALLQIGSPEEAGTEKPKPIRLTSKPLSVFDQIAVVGFPAPPKVFLGTGTPPVDHELEEVLRLVFDKRFGFKRCATGEIDEAAGSNPKDLESWTVAHDASTLGGNSGSPLIPINGTPGPAVAALHFGGSPRETNYAHVFSRLGRILDEFGVPIDT